MFLFGGPYRIRTGDLLHAMQALYQLSQRPSKVALAIVANLSPTFKSEANSLGNLRYHWQRPALAHGCEIHPGQAQSSKSDPGDRT